MSFRRIAFIAFLVLLAALPLLPVPEFWITQANYIGLYTLVALGLVLLTGVAGLTSFGQAAFVGLGAYTAAFLTLKYGVSPWLTVWVGLGVTFVAALVLGWVTLRMSGHYLPLATIAWGLSLYYLLGNIDALGKYDGLLGVPAIEFFGIALNTGRGFHYLLWILVVLAAVAVTRLLDSRTGRALRARHIAHSRPSTASACRRSPMRPGQCEAAPSHAPATASAMPIVINTADSSLPGRPNTRCHIDRRLVVRPGTGTSAHSA